MPRKRIDREDFTKVGAFVSSHDGSTRVELFVCPRCAALVQDSDDTPDIDTHIDWHDRLARGVEGLPDLT